MSEQDKIPEGEPIEELNEYHKDVIKEWCEKISEDVAKIWPIIEEYCGDYFEIDLGKVSMTIQKNDHKSIPENWWYKIDEPQPPEEPPKEST